MTVFKFFLKWESKLFDMIRKRVILKTKNLTNYNLQGLYLQEESQIKLAKSIN